MNPVKTLREAKTFFNSTDMSLSKLEDGEGQGSLVCCSPSLGTSLGLQRVGHNGVTEQQLGSWPPKPLAMAGPMIGSHSMLHSVAMAMMALILCAHSKVAISIWI